MLRDLRGIREGVQVNRENEFIIDPFLCLYLCLFILAIWWFYKLLTEDDLKHLLFVCVFAFSNLLSFIFHHSKIRINQQIKDDTKYYKHLGATLYLCWSVKFTMYCKVRLWKFCLAYFLNTRNQCLLRKLSVSKYCPTLIQTPFQSDLFSECDVLNGNLRHQYLSVWKHWGFVLNVVINYVSH